MAAALAGRTDGEVLAELDLPAPEAEIGAAWLAGARAAISDHIQEWVEQVRRYRSGDIAYHLTAAQKTRLEWQLLADPRGARAAVALLSASSPGRAAPVVRQVSGRRLAGPRGDQGGARSPDPAPAMYRVLDKVVPAADVPKLNWVLDGRFADGRNALAAGRVEPRPQAEGAFSAGLLSPQLAGIELGAPLAGEPAGSYHRDGQRPDRGRLPPDRQGARRPPAAAAGARRVVAGRGHQRGSGPWRRARQGRRIWAGTAADPAAPRHPGRMGVGARAVMFGWRGRRPDRWPPPRQPLAPRLRRPRMSGPAGHQPRARRPGESPPAASRWPRRRSGGRAEPRGRSGSCAKPSASGRPWSARSPRARHRPAPPQPGWRPGCRRSGRRDGADHRAGRAGRGGWACRAADRPGGPAARGRGTSGGGPSGGKLERGAVSPTSSRARRQQRALAGKAGTGGAALQGEVLDDGCPPGCPANRARSLSGAQIQGRRACLCCVVVCLCVTPTGTWALLRRPGCTLHLALQELRPECRGILLHVAVERERRSPGCCLTLQDELRQIEEAALTGRVAGSGWSSSA